jgi:hypothetical protein
LPAFSAETVVEALDFTFAYKVGDEAVPGPSGVIKEPSDRQIAEFLQGIKDVVKSVEKDIPGGVPGDDPAALLQAADDLDPERVVSLMAAMADKYAALCSGFPSAEQILALPMRRRQGFFLWLQQEVMSPEAGPGAGRAQVIQLPRAAAG